ncbi:MAG: hypothetical protein RR623_08505 [Bacilli bacterium]
MFDLYGLNGEKKLSNIVQGNRIDYYNPIDVVIQNDNFKSAMFLVVEILRINGFYYSSAITGGDNAHTANGYLIFFSFDKVNGTIKVTIPQSEDKTKWKITSVTYIK